MRVLSVGVLACSALMASGCSTPTLFPPGATSDATPVEFGVVRAQPDVFKGRVVQLAGRIVGVEESNHGYQIRAQELPLEQHPVYGPGEARGRTPEFAIAYSGKLDPSARWYGNKFVVVAVAQGTQDVTVDGNVRNEPYVVATCMHIWKTGEYGSYGLGDFPHTTDGYYPLEHDTYCVN
ncbi:MAG: Slp family lipoprotein [Nitrospiraceae bacterium]|nr:Slp family lipoprotein [Nitrospiraceae bacterium]